MTNPAAVRDADASHSAKLPHAVVFHSDDALLIEQIVSFLAPAFAAGGGAIVVARKERNGALQRALPHAHRNSVVFEDADLMLARLRGSTGAFDPEAFERHVGATIDRVAGPSLRRVHIYGEMVDVLWRAGDSHGALALEELWAQAAERRSFSLLCGYHAAAVTGMQGSHHAHAILARHTHVARDTGALVDAKRVISELESKSAKLSGDLLTKRDATSRLEGLLEASTELLRVSTRREIAEIVLHAATTTLGAESGAMWIAADSGDGGLVLEHAVKMPPEWCAKSTRLAPADVAGDGRIGLVVDGRVLGAVALQFPQHAGDDDRVREEDRAYSELLARHAAQALERLRLYEAEQQARLAAEAAAADTHALYRLADAVHRATSTEEIYTLAVDAAAAMLPATGAAVIALDNDGIMRVLTRRGFTDEVVAVFDGHMPQMLKPPEHAPRVVDDVLADPVWAHAAPVFRAGGVRCLGFVPLVQHGTMLGKLLVSTDVPRRFGEREIGIATAVAAHAADAVERARAQERERTSRIAAEDASRAREEILSIVSHDLRNPLSAILMAAGSLLRIEGVDARAQRARTHAQRVQRNVERMTRLIDDLIDFSAISTGRLTLKKADHAPDDIVRAAVDLFQAIAEPRGLGLVGDVAEALPHLRCDHDRVVQAIANLVSNAMKVTGPGGSITISAQLIERDIVFAVMDTGPGIRADEINRVFDRYWRSSAVTYKGTGLGLSIARGIVEAHGGKIWAESVYGEGATFSFSIPGVIVD